MSKKIPFSSEKEPILHAPIKIPTGIDDFKELITAGFFFVDKSRFIVDLVQATPKVTLITRPRRFGKTLNLSMLYYFFSIENAKEHKKLFKNFAVHHSPEAMAHMGQYPVIMLTLKSMKAASLEEQLNYFKTMMKKLYIQHDYLYDHLSPREKHSFDQVCQETVNTSQLASSLEELISYMSRHYDKQVIVLFDEYDQPLLNAYHKGFEGAFSDFYRNFVSAALKGNINLHFAVVTGIMQMAGSGMFSDFNNATMLNLLNERYATCFGFTEAEVGNLLSLAGKEDKLPQIKQWYNGYLFGAKGHVIYNPWSVLQYLYQDCTPKAYWTNNSDNVLLKKELFAANDDTQAKFLSLMVKDGCVEASLPDTLFLSDVATNKEHALWTLLLSAGYLKAHIKPSPSGQITVDLSIPNEEVRQIYHRLFEERLSSQLRTIQGGTSLLDHLNNGNIEAFCQTLERFFIETVSVHDVRFDTIESFYHGFMLGLLSTLRQTHTGHLRSNRESGFGRFDIAIMPLNPKQDLGIVFEIKRLDSTPDNQMEDLLKEKATEGIKQIETKRYDAELRAQGTKRIIHIALAFCGKHMAYQYKQIS